MVHGGLRLLSRLRRRRVMERLATTLRSLASLSEGIASLERMLKPAAASALKSLPDAARLLRECEGWAGELEGLSIAKAVAPRLSKASDKLNNTLLKSLHSVCASFDGDAYDNALTTAIRLGQIADVVGGVNIGAARNQRAADGRAAREAEEARYTQSAADLSRMKKEAVGRDDKGRW